MPCENREKIIDGEKWTVMQMPPTEALAFETRIAPVLIQGIIPMLGMLGTLGKSDDEQTMKIFASGFSSMTTQIPPEEMASIIKALCSQCFRNGERVVFEKDFQGGKGVMRRYRVAWFVLEANYSDFFGEMLPAGVMERARAMFQKKAAAASAVESTGESGGLVSPTLRSAG